LMDDDDDDDKKYKAEHVRNVLLRQQEAPN